MYFQKKKRSGIIIKDVIYLDGKSGNVSEQMKELGFGIAYFRKKAGLSQQELADLVGISRQHLGAIEAPNMERPFSVELLFRLAAALSVEAKELFFFVRPL